MGSQVPDVPVRFAVSFGRRLLYDPALNSVEPVARAAWFEANLIATEYDGRFPELAIRQRFVLWWSANSDFLTWFNETILGPLVKAELWLEDGEGWYRINGWEKYQPEPTISKPAKDPTGAERQRRYRDRHVTPRNGGNGDVTPRARPSGSSSSSVSRPSRKRVRDDTLADKASKDPRSLKDILREANGGVDPLTPKS